MRSCSDFLRDFFDVRELKAKGLVHRCKYWYKISAREQKVFYIRMDQTKAFFSQMDYENKI